MTTTPASHHLKRSTSSPQSKKQQTSLPNTLAHHLLHSPTVVVALVTNKKE